MATGQRRGIVLAVMLGIAGWASACGDGATEPSPPPPADQAPETVGSIPDQTVTAGETATLDVSSYFSDPDGDALSYEASTSDVSVATASLSGNTLTIAGVAAGMTTVTVTATAGDQSAQQTVNVTVGRRDQAPETVGSIPDQTVTAGETVTLDVSSYFSDPDGDALSYEASTSDVSVAAASLSGNTLTIAGVAAGMTTVTVTATAGDQSAQQIVNVTVERPNQAPEAVGSIPDQVISAGNTVTVDLSLYFSDPDGDALSYEETTSNIAIVAPTVSGKILTIAGVAQGSATITVTATDPGGLSAQQTAKVTVGERSQDREALVALYEATSGDFYWDIDTNWLSDRPLGTWYGVATDDDGRVVELILSGNTVWGEIPSAIVHLTKLQRLDLSDNRVNGDLPTEIGDLRELVELNLSENTFLGSGSPIPAALGKLHKLELLNLTDTNFNDEIPRELGNLESLVQLELAEMTWLDGGIPPEFSKLTNLKHLDVSGGGLDNALPQDLVKLTLQFFHWNGNRMCSPSNTEFQAWLNGISDHRGGQICR